MKALITGFDPFGNESINPSFEAVKLLPETLDGAEIVKLELPTAFDRAAAWLRKAIEREQPDIVLCVGQAGGRASISVEKVAINYRHASIPDNEGKQPQDELIAPEGKTAYFSTLPVRRIVETLQETGIPAQISYTAGTYVCNELMYRLLQTIEQEKLPIRGGFIHVPFEPQQTAAKPGPVPSMSRELMAKALETAIRVSAEA